MTGMPTHRKGWTASESALAVIYALLCPLIGVFAFVEIYQTVTHLVHPWFGDWAWIVPASAEGMFTALYIGWVLLELRDDPPRRVRYLTAGFLAACGLGSYWLNIYAAHGVVPSAVAHGVVVTAFFGVLIFGKVLLRRLNVTPSQRAMEGAMGDARQYAIDLVRAEKGLLWRWRGDIPSLLRRYILTGRLSHEVREAVRLAVSIGRTSGWEAAVREWVFGPDGLSLATLARETSRMAVSDIARQARGSEPEPELGASPAAENVPEAAPQARSQARPKRVPEHASKAALKLAPGLARGMSPDKVAEHVIAMIEEYGDASVNRVKKDLCVGTEKATAALEIAKREMRSRTVVPMTARG